MKTLSCYNVEETAKTIYEIVCNEDIDIEGVEFLTKPYCHFITKVGDYRFFIKYEAPEGTKEAFFNNGYFQVDVEIDKNFEFLVIDRINPYKKVIEL